jgi:hypothetical protein
VGFAPPRGEDLLAPQREEESGLATVQFVALCEDGDAA